MTPEEILMLGKLIARAYEICREKDILPPADEQGTQEMETPNA